VNLFRQFPFRQTFEGIEDQLQQCGAVLAAAEARDPNAVVGKVWLVYFRNDGFEWYGIALVRRGSTVNWLPRL
jgi:hypothetical protein